MRTRDNINKTLEKYLFTSPKPAKNRKEYFELFNFIFPGKEIFSAFLEEENYDQQVYWAKKILLRLSYDSFFSPPTRLLFNNLSMETKQSVSIKENYVGRDHFVHLVHLYLLGIYVFFYHQILNENIFVEFKKKRQIADINSNNINNSVVKDFIVAWRYFVLFHDISYPLEYYLGNEKFKKSNEKEEFLKPFKNIPKYIGKDLSLKSLSKFIAVYKLIKNASDYSFKNLILSAINETTHDVENTESYYQIEKIYGFDTFKNVYAIFDKSNIIPVLYEKNRMLPVLVYFPIKEESENKVHVLETKYYKKNNILNNLKDIEDAPYIKDYFNLKNYSWGYFINSSITLQSLIEDLFPNVTLADFDKAIEYIHGLTSSNYSMVLSDSGFRQYCFDIYSALYKLAGFQYSDEDINDDNTHFRHLSHIVSNVGQEIPKKISTIINNLIESKLSDIDFEKDMRQQTSLEKLVHNYLKKIATGYRELSKEIAESLKSDIGTQLELKNNIYEIRKSIKSIFEDKGIKNKLNIDTELDKVIISELSKDDELLNAIVEKLNLKASKSGLKDFAYIRGYKGKYSNFDHGVYSSLLFLAVADLYNQLILSGKNDYNFRKLLTVAIGLDLLRDEKYMNYKQKYIFVETSFAISTHNIYPANLEIANTKFRTKLETCPFAYFSILLDSLQDWDRKIQINQGLNDLPYQTLSRSFNIVVKNNKIRISEFDQRINIQKKLKRMKTELNHYLENASDFIELNFGEF